MEPIYRVVGSRAKCRLTPTYDQAWGLKYSTVLDLPRAAQCSARGARARRRAALVTRIGRMKVKLKACHTLGRAHLQFTRWLIKPTSEARNTGAATCDTCTIQCTAAPRMSHIGHVRRMEDHLSCPHTREERHCPRRAKQRAVGKERCLRDRITSHRVLYEYNQLIHTYVYKGPFSGIRPFLQHILHCCTQHV